MPRVLKRTAARRCNRGVAKATPSQASSTVACSLSDCSAFLPGVVSKIFSFLDSADFYNCCCSCKNVAEVINDTDAWECSSKAMGIILTKCSVLKLQKLSNMKPLPQVLNFIYRGVFWTWFHFGLIPHALNTQVAMMMMLAGADGHSKAMLSMGRTPTNLKLRNATAERTTWYTADVQNHDLTDDDLVPADSEEPFGRSGRYRVDVDVSVKASGEMWSVSYMKTATYSGEAFYEEDVIVIDINNMPVLYMQCTSGDVDQQDEDSVDGKLMVEVLMPLASVKTHFMLTVLASPLHRCSEPHNQSQNYSYFMRIFRGYVSHFCQMGHPELLPTKIYLESDSRVGAVWIPPGGYDENAESENGDEDMMSTISSGDGGDATE